MTVIVAWWRRVAGLSARMVGCWLTSVAVLGAGLAVFDDLVYGGPLTTGYRAGEVTFSATAIVTNLHAMPEHLVQAMPMLVLLSPHSRGYSRGNSRCATCPTLRAEQLVAIYGS